MPYNILDRKVAIGPGKAPCVSNPDRSGLPEWKVSISCSVELFLGSGKKTTVRKKEGKKERKPVSKKMASRIPHPQFPGPPLI